MDANIDPAKAEAFGAQMLQLINHATLSLMLSVGHRTGLFDTLAGMDPATSADIARAAKLDERYVREWLAAMACGRIVDYDAAVETYWLPREHAGAVTRAAGPNNFAMVAQCVGFAALHEDGIVECFRKGGGVGYEAQARFAQLQAELSASTHEAMLVGAMLPISPALVERLERGADVIDVGCGYGSAVILMAEAFPKSRFSGVDTSEASVVRARTEARERGLDNVRFAVGDVHALEVGDGYDVITAFEVIHDLAHPVDGLRAIQRALRPGGTLFMVEPCASSHLADNLEHPLGPFLYTASTFHCMTVSLAQGGEGCGTAWGEDNTRAALARAGFAHVDVKHLEGDFMNAYYIAQRAS